MNQKISHKKPIAPMIKKADSQPHFETIQGTDNGAKMAPTLVPELNIPVANDLSFFGKYSAVALMAAGKLPASPNPKMALENIKPAIEKGTEVIPIHPNTATILIPSGIAQACKIAANDQMMMAQAYPDLVPNLSTILPANNKLIAYTN